MSVSQVCAPCSAGDCGKCIPQDPPRDKDGLFMGSIFIGGTSCPCRHTPEDRAEHRRRADESFKRFIRSPAITQRETLQRDLDAYALALSNLVSACDRHSRGAIHGDLMRAIAEARELLGEDGR